MDGFVNFLKPPGMTSHDAVNFIRKQLKMKKVGHTGTLDPGVAGVLPVCLGKATKLAEYVTTQPKSYRAEITLGVTTDSQDAYGVIQSTSDCTNIKYQQFVDLIPEFIGTISQTPPMLSAGRSGGIRLYQLARKGIEVERKPKTVTIYKITVFKKDWHLPHPKITFDMICSKGTYVRTLCHDIGQKLGVGAHMSFLIRTQSGSFHIEEAITIDEMTSLIKNNNLSFVHPMQIGIDFIPSFTVDAIQSNAIIHGNSIILTDNRFFNNGLYRVENLEKALLAIGQVTKTTDNVFLFKPEKVFV